MRIFELLILTTLLAVLLGFLIRRSNRPGWLKMFSWLALGLLLLHLGFEQYRWQMAPAYGLVGLIFLLALRKAPGDATKDSFWRTTGRIAVVAVGLVVCATTAFLALKIPVFRDPAPSGPFAVGSTRLYFVDSSRHDPFAPDPRAPRELLVVVWYPAEIAAGAKPENFWPELPVTWPKIAQRLHLPTFLPTHLRLVQSHSYPNAPVAHSQTQYPVLFFSHGYGSTPWQNTPQMEELASQGFVVFSIGHTYESAAIAFSESRIVLLNQARFEAISKAADSGQMKELTERLRAANQPQEIRQIATQMTHASGAEESLQVWVADTLYVMDEVAKLNAGTIERANQSGNRFARRLDLARLGVFGMSFGGAAAGELCRRDPRCKAGLNMDGKQSGDAINQKLSVPFLYFSSESSQEDRKINDAIYESSLGDFYSVHVQHSTHLNFSDVSLILPILRGTPLLGSINGREMEKIMNAYTLAFFQKYLLGKPAPLLDGQPPVGEFPEVVFAAHRSAVARPAGFETPR